MCYSYRTTNWFPCVGWSIARTKGKWNSLNYWYSHNWMLDIQSPQLVLKYSCFHHTKDVWKMVIASSHICYKWSNAGFSSPMAIPTEMASYCCGFKIFCLCCSFKLPGQNSFLFFPPSLKIRALYSFTNRISSVKKWWIVPSCTRNLSLIHPSPDDRITHKFVLLSIWITFFSTIGQSVYL